MKVLSILKYKNKKQLMILCKHDDNVNVVSFSDYLLWLKIVGLDDTLNIVGDNNIEVVKILRD